MRVSRKSIDFCISAPWGQIFHHSGSGLYTTCLRKNIQRLLNSWELQLNLPHVANETAIQKHRIKCYFRCCVVRLRLAGTGVIHRGRLEVFHNSNWGTVTTSSFDDVDARVFCYQLGFGWVRCTWDLGLWRPGFLEKPMTDIRTTIATIILSMFNNYNIIIIIIFIIILSSSFDVMCHRSLHIW